MKAIDIALKDLTRSFRSAFALVFMFGVPLLMTGMFYFMFGNSSSGNLQLPRRASSSQSRRRWSALSNQREEFFRAARKPHTGRDGRQRVGK